MELFRLLLQMIASSSTFFSLFLCGECSPCCRILTEQIDWLSWKTHLSTPYSRIASIQFVIAPYSFEDGTVNRIIHSSNGQMAEYSSHHGTASQVIDHQQWPDMLTTLIREIKSAVSAQMPSNMPLSDFIDYTIEDDYSPNSPHRQKANVTNITGDSMR